MKKVISIFIMLILLLLLTGCFKLDINQKIKRNGKTDMTITLKSDYPLILDAWELEIDPSITEKYTYTETDNSKTYSFTNIDPFKEGNLFKVKGESEDTYSQFLNKENYQFEKTFSFPYYYYNLKIITKENKESKDVEDDWGLSESFDEIFKVGYTLEVFGKIIETNGNKLSDNKVKFQMSIDKDETYYVKFRDFFLISWIGYILG